MKEWTLGPDGWRTWSRVPNAAKWSTEPTDVVSRAQSGAGSPIGLAPAGYTTVAKRLVGLYADDIGKAVAGDARAAWYRLALLSLMCIELPSGKLPGYGDWRDANKKVVAPNTPGASPLSVGLYQFTKGAAAKVGVTWDELASSPTANHAAAYKLAKSYEPQHDGDFPCLAVLWNVGLVRADAANAWGVHLWSPTLLTKYVSAQMAVAGELAGKSSSSSSSSGGGVLAGGLLAALIFGAS